MEVVSLITFLGQLGNQKLYQTTLLRSLALPRSLPLAIIRMVEDILIYLLQQPII